MNDLPGEAPTIAIDAMHPGDTGVIARVDAEPAIVRRLMELGLVPGTELQHVRVAPLGDPIEVSIRGVHLSLRRSEASRIHVTPR